MDWSLTISLFLLLSAPFVGSFINLVAERWPKGESFVYGRSHCGHCGHVLGWNDLVPVVSWGIARGKCRYCNIRISIRHPVAELSALGVAVWSFALFSGPMSWITVLFGWTLLAVSLVDLRWLWLPDALTLALGLAGLVTGWVLTPADVPGRLIGAAAAYAILTLAAWIYRRYRKREGLGAGDPRLFGAIGAWVGWQGLGTVLLYAGICGLLLVLIRARGAHPVGLTTRLPFGPCLCVGAWLVWLYGPLYVGPAN
jgi:leader peptidase (prepilin peptidase) / N-methyltransferase